MNESNIFFEFGVFKVLFPIFLVENQQNAWSISFQISILPIKQSNFYGVPQKILHCDIRIPESQKLFPGLSYTATRKSKNVLQ